ncbi:MAG: uroporphyrinogen-III C-methyltransferase [Burkholderiales bacterium]|nr:uroporphyrinogen-III C-methyltransferase [Burkholderiales bacterium]
MSAPADRVDLPEADRQRRADAPRSGPAERVRRIGIAAVAILAVGVALAWLDARRELSALRGEVAARLAVNDGAEAQAKARDAAMAGDLREAQAKLALLEARLAESQSQQASLETLYRDLAPSRDELAVVEVEQILSLASQQLAIAGNVPAAIAALQLADGKLARLDRPKFAPLRRAIAADLEKLKAVPYVDTAGLAGRLDAAIQSIDAMPLARDDRLPPPVPAPPLAEAPAWSRFLREAWADFKSLVRVEVSDRPEPPLLAPPQQYYLRENLRLRLLSARLALIARNDAAFRADVKAADAWLRQYFDARAKPVAAALASLALMSSATMSAELPELARSLDAARALRVAQEARADAPRGRP